MSLTGLEKARRVRAVKAKKDRSAAEARERTRVVKLRRWIDAEGARQLAYIHTQIDSGTRDEKDLSVLKDRRTEILRRAEQLKR